MASRALVTGGTAGLGFETVRGLLEGGWEVDFTGTSRERGEAALRALDSLGLKGRARAHVLDLSSRSSREAFSARLLGEGQVLDLMVNNAGLLLPRLERTAEGLEKHFQVNYLGHFHLNALLYPLLSPEGRILHLGSLSHHKAILRLEDLSFQETPYTRMAAYGQSKLALTLYGLELARRLSGTEQRSIVTHPGVCNTRIVSRYLPGPLGRVLDPAAWFLGITKAPEGARHLLHGALEDLPSGAYVGPSGGREWKGEPGFCRLSPHARDQELGEALWRKSEALLGITFPLSPVR